MLLIAYATIPPILAAAAWCAGVVICWRLWAHPERGPFATTAGIR